MTLFGFLEIGIIDIVDIIVVAILLSYTYKLAKGTVAINIFIGIVIVYLIWKTTEMLNMEILSSIFGKFIGVGFFALIVVFQEEIRKFLLLLGSSSISRKGGIGRIFDFIKHEKAETDVASLVRVCQNLSQTKTGALIVIERSTPLEFIQKTGDKMSIGIDPNILENFFEKESPLHDGGIIISGNRIVATRTILPLTKNPNIPNRYGLRHRSAIGISESTDAVVLVVSEETGRISYIKEGRFIPFDTPQELILIVNRDMGISSRD